MHTYADAKPSELVLLVDSYGLLSLALDRASAAAELGLRAGSGVTLAVDPSRRRIELPVRRPGSRTSIPERRAMRPGTTIAIVVLLVLILGAAIAQFVLQLGP